MPRPRDQAQNFFLVFQQACPAYGCFDRSIIDLGHRWTVVHASLSLQGISTSKAPQGQDVPPGVSNGESVNVQAHSHAAIKSPRSDHHGGPSMCDVGFALDCVGGAGGISSNKIETCHSRKCVSVVVSSERCKTRSASAVLPRVYLRVPPEFADRHHVPYAATFRESMCVLRPVGNAVRLKRTQALRGGRRLQRIPKHGGGLGGSGPQACKQRLFLRPLPRGTAFDLPTCSATLRCSIRPAK